MPKSNISDEVVQQVVKEKSKNTLLKIILVLLIIIIIVLLLLRGCGPGNGTGGQVLEPDYELVDPDDNATAIPDDPVPSEKPDVPQGGGSMSLIYSDQVSVNLSSGKVGLFYQNPSDSSHSIVVQIIIQRGDTQYLVAQSGAIDPGFMLTEMTMEKGLQLAPGGYEGFLKLLFFDPDTGERAVVDTNIPADITVQ